MLPPLAIAVSDLGGNGLGGGIGLGLDRNIQSAYAWLCRNYQPGDAIYLFGFSRGAYTVRALAAMIKRCGLLHPEFSNLVEYGWSVYSDEDRSDDARRTFGGPARIKKLFSRNITIHFVGVWDTVAAFGWLWDILSLPDTVKNDAIVRIRHAVSIDERRSAFRPTRVKPADGQDCKEVWFAGVHADVGGGYPRPQAGLARFPLQWMIGEAIAAGLDIDAQRRDEVLEEMGAPEIVDHHLAEAHDESIKLGWRLLGWLPRRSFSMRVRRRAWQWPNRAAARDLGSALLAHESVQLRMRGTQGVYNPRFPEGVTFVP